MTGAAAPGPDGRLRCPWALATPDYVAYHDDEWGVPVHGDRELFERVTLEAFQSGLSWLTILRKRVAFRAAFADFDPTRVASFGDDDVARLLADAGIVRNRAKIEATLANARALLALQAERGPRALTSLVHGAAPDQGSPPRVLADVPASTPQSRRLAADLRAVGFRFVGPTTAYSTMQAVGVVDDHLVGCVARRT